MEYEVDLLPKIKLEIVVADSRLDEVTRIISSTARTGKIGDGKIFIYDVLEAIRIRNDDTGEAAL
jgi:nitrogen regulatory protein P-II 1